MNRYALVGVALVTSLLAACATGGRISDAERLEIYRANAGEPVKSIRYFGSINGWTPLGDKAMALWTRPNEAWLLEFGGFCPDLEFAQAVAVTSQFNRVSAKFDKVRVLGQGTTPIPCIIQEIRPLDIKNIRIAEAERREAGTVPDEPAAAE